MTNPRDARPVAVSAALLCACLMLRATAFAQAPASAPTESVRLHFPSFGISVPVPQGFERDTDMDASIVMFVPTGQAGKMPDRAVSVMVVPSKQGSLREIIDDSVMRNGVKPQGRQVTWAGVTATEFDRDENVPDGGRFVARRIIVAQRGPIVYLLIYATDSAHAKDLSGYEAVKQGAQLADVSYPGDALVLHLPKLRGPNGILLPIPDPFRPVIHDKNRTTSQWLARDFRGEEVAAALLVIPLPADGTIKNLAEAKLSVEQRLVPSLKLKSGPIRWNDRPGAKMPRSATDRAQVPDGFARVLVVSNATNGTTVFLLTYGDAPDEELKKIEQTIEVIERGFE